MRRNTRNDLLSALLALTDKDDGWEKPGKGFKTSKEYEKVFFLGQKQTYNWLEKLVNSDLAEKKTFRIRLGLARRMVPHYRLDKRALSIVRKMRCGRGPRGEA